MTSLTNDAVSLCSAVNQLKFMILFVETFKIINFEVNYIQDFLSNILSFRNPLPNPSNNILHIKLK